MSPVKSALPVVLPVFVVAMLVAVLVNVIVLETEFGSGVKVTVIDVGVV